MAKMETSPIRYLQSWGNEITPTKGQTLDSTCKRKEAVFCKTKFN